MRQCLLQRGPCRLTAWLPDEFAKAGTWLELKQKNGLDRTWQVVQVYNLWQKTVEEPHGYFAGGVTHQS